jgi:5-methylcytosine-specific restriction endonuclease McrA
MQHEAYALAKTCSVCKQEKPLDDFPKDSSRKDGRMGRCRPCDNARSADYYQRNHAKALAKRNTATRAKRKVRVLAPALCASCGEAFTPTHAGRSTYCSRKCGERKRDAENPNRYKPRVCIVCGDQYKPTGYHAKVCADPVCRYLQNGRKNYSPIRFRLAVSTWKPEPKRPTSVRTCPECSGTWVSGERHLSRRYCSRRCARRAQRRRTKAIRRARLMNAPKREVIDLNVLAERDGWRCHICKRKVTRTTWSHDHLVPLSHGGDHTYANVALAHHRCNTLRGAHGAAQLRLCG